MILLLGHTGYIGGEFKRQLESSGIEHRSISRSELDYTRRDVLISLIRESHATFLINAAGYTGKPNVDACEQHKSECLDGNAVLPGTIREACEMAGGIPWGHVSSGCIYTGRRHDGQGFTETDEPNFCFRTNNCSWYSGCKALGEEVLADADDVFIWRLRIPFNEQASSRNYLSKLIRYERLLQAENSISHLAEFVSACLECWHRRVPFGIYNVTNTGSVTTRQVTEMIQRHLLPDKTYDFFESEAEFMQLAAKTPRSNCVMDNTKLLSTGIKISNIQEALSQSLRDWSDE
ncbi:sugar nucleotide-binding protein [Neorhodopirellula pilleata]|uniref:dTDP-4-dehydrorhamnose reductase n=1 Tax=Neorhodopirellula pilleata TaxID=2714738 RepID=A0A5C6A8G3_9BACT|nr:sugar nucleotide-binding protein [Neorhodopirellula pilleata]TWT96254.1 RmlD substrate binding domain protein [Neorhodopirellula pilleata]